MKTNAARILEQKKISFSLYEYEFNQDEIDAVSVAKKIGAELNRVFKTLVAYGDKNGINIFVIPGNSTLDLKKAAACSNNKKVEMIKEKELLPLTGYIKGGCSPIGMKKNYPTYIDQSVFKFSKIFVSAGKRGLQLQISPSDLLKVTNAYAKNLI